MKPNKLRALVQTGDAQSYAQGEVFHSLDFKEQLYIVKSGYVKRYQVGEDQKQIIESIYGSGYLFPLSQVYSRLLNFELSQESITYIYEAMTNVEIQGIGSEELAAAAKKDPMIYRDLFYESGVRLKANINRLASNAFTNDYQKITHQLANLANEFGEAEANGGQDKVKILVPLKPVDMAEQLNISTQSADAIMDNLEKRGLIVVEDEHIMVPNIAMLKDAYL